MVVVVPTIAAWHDQSLFKRATLKMVCAQYATTINYIYTGTGTSLLFFWLLFQEMWWTVATVYKRPSNVGYRQKLCVMFIDKQHLSVVHAVYDLNPFILLTCISFILIQKQLSIWICILKFAKSFVNIKYKFYKQPIWLNHFYLSAKSRTMIDYL